jgi:hypothetical protein
MTVLILVLWVLAVMRVTRLINFDTIMDWLHIRVARRFGPNSWQLLFLSCPWCVGMWVAAGTAWAPILLTDGDLSWWTYPLLFLSASMIVGLAAPLSSEDDEMVEA